MVGLGARAAALLRRPLERHRPPVLGEGEASLASTLSGWPARSRSRSAACPIGGGAPVVVQSMTLTKTHDVDRDDRADRGARLGGLRDRTRGGSEERGRGGAAADRAALAAPGHRGHPLQRVARAEGDRRGRRRGADQPRQHRRPGQGRAGRARREGGRHPDADRRQLGLAAEAPARARPGGSGRGARRRRARGGRAAREARVPRLQDLGQGDARADDDPRLPDARRQGAVPAPSRGDRGGHRSSRARSRARSASGRCSPTGSATRCASRSPPIRSRRSRSPGRSSRRSACASGGR